MALAMISSCLSFPLLLYHLQDQNLLFAYFAATVAAEIALAKKVRDGLCAFHGDLGMAQHAVIPYNTSRQPGT
jgi:hypothetical protein